MLAGGGYPSMVLHPGTAALAVPCAPRLSTVQIIERY
jgi:hypothetical protein